MRAIIMLSCAILAVTTFAATVPGELLDAIATVESHNNDHAVGDHGKAVGRYQLHPIAVREANRIMKRDVYTLSDRTDSVKAREITATILSYWGNRYERDTGKVATPEVLAKIHNGGAFWRRKIKTEKYVNNLKAYWRKVGAAMGGIEQ